MSKDKANGVYVPRFGRRSLSRSITETSQTTGGPCIKRNESASILKGLENKTGEKVKRDKPRKDMGAGIMGASEVKISKPLLPEKSQLSTDAYTRNHSDVDGDVFHFSYTVNESPSKLSALEQGVLKTISKMLLENRHIRKRLHRLHLRCPESDKCQVISHTPPIKRGVLQ